MSSNVYDTLGVPANASQAEVKRAYRKLARLHHPDRDSGDAARFHEIQAAYDVLSDPAERDRYDHLRATPTRVPTRPPTRGSRAATIDIRVDVGHVFEDVVNGVVDGLRGLGRKRGS
jgi:molecular chaperone DnaJ